MTFFAHSFFEWSYYARFSPDFYNEEDGNTRKCFVQNVKGPNGERRWKGTISAVEWMVNFEEI